MPRPVFFVVLLTAVGLLASCSSSGGAGNATTANGDTPTAAYKRLFEAVKSKNTDAIKAQLTKRTIQQAQSSAKQWGKPEEAVLEHGMVASTMSDTLPEIRDERIKDKMGAIEVWNAYNNMWEDLPFMVEDGQFKLALGELFAGAYKSPGMPQTVRDRQAANAAGPLNVNAAPVNRPNTNSRK